MNKTCIRCYGSALTWWECISQSDKNANLEGEMWSESLASPGKLNDGMGLREIRFSRALVEGSVWAEDGGWRGRGGGYIERIFVMWGEGRRVGGLAELDFKGVVRVTRGKSWALIPPLIPIEEDIYPPPHPSSPLPPPPSHDCWDRLSITWLMVSIFCQMTAGMPRCRITLTTPVHTIARLVMSPVTWLHACMLAAVVVKGKVARDF
jgi:hypothetical protein